MKKILLALTIGLAAMGCRDREKEAQDQLPPITQTGANTAGCLVNGKVLIPKNGSQNFGGPPAYGLKSLQGDDFWPNQDDWKVIKITNYINSDKGELYIYIDNMKKGKGDYIIGQSDGEFFPYGPKNPHMIYRVIKNNNQLTYYSSDNCGIINFTKADLMYGVSLYSGTFFATLYNKDNPLDKIQITEGRFDINNLTLNK